jgi:long-chain acyl-CoA synthetase
MVHGDRHPHLVALLVPDADFIKDWAARNNAADDLAALVESPAFTRAVGAAVERVNSMLAPLERIRRFAVLPESFTIDNAMLTPSLKIRRHKIREKWGDTLKKLYERS